MTVTPPSNWAKIGLIRGQLSKDESGIDGKFETLGSTEEAENRELISWYSTKLWAAIVAIRLLSPSSVPR